MRLAFVLVLASLMLTGCSIWGTGGGDPEHDRYFSGSRGIEMCFQPGSPPNNVFYYYGAPAEDNKFEVVVELKNEGASDAIGATYISGYSPDLVSFTGVDIRRQGISDCTFDLTRLISGGDFGFFFSCEGIEVLAGGAGDWNVRIQEIGRLIPGLEFLETVDVGIGQQGGGWSLDIGWDNFGSLDVLYHGRALAIILSSIDWRAYNGFPFNGGQEKIGPGILRGDNYFYPGGEMGFQVFEGTLGSEWPAGLDEADIDFMVTSCYGYSTFAAPNICIDPAPFDQTKKVCSPVSNPMTGTQGAPVAISRLTQDPFSRKVFLTFTVRQVDNSGQIFNIGHMQRCSPYFPGRMDSRHQDVIHVGDVRIGDQRLRCTPGYEIRLVEGVGTFTCEYDLEYATAKSAYKTPVVVELWYGFSDSIQTRMHVKRVV